MTKEQLIQRIEELKHGLEQSAANHNSIIGRLQEAQFVLEKMEEFQNELVLENECADIECIQQDSLAI